jgi:uncharacterized membrane protein
MNKKRLTVMLDVVFAVAMIWATREIGLPYERTLQGFWSIRRELMRTASSLLWMISLWLGLYRPLDRAARVDRWTVLCGAGLMLLALPLHWFTTLVIFSYKARLSQILYGGYMLLTVAMNFLLQLALERANADVPGCAEAARDHRKALLGAAGILAAGLALSVIRFRQASWYSVVVASVYLIVMAVIQGKED